MQYAQAGQRAALRQAGPRLRALLFAREAQGCGLLRDRAATVDALGRANRAFNSHHGHDPGWTEFFTQAELAGAAGSAFRMLDDPHESVRYLQDAVLIEGRARNRTSWVLHLAESLAAAGEHDHAYAVASEVMPVISDLTSTRIHRHLRRVAKALTPYANTPEGRAFQDQVAALTLAS